MNFRSSILLRVRVAFLAVLLFAMAVGYKIFDIQTMDDGKWKKKAKDIGLQYRTVKATRGNIYSDNGSLLATSLPFYKVAFDPSLADDKLYQANIDQLAGLLSDFFKDYSKTAYKRRINDARLTGRRYMVINRKEINYQSKKIMQEWPIFREGRLRGGVIFEKVDTRYHPFKYLGYRTIGSLNEDDRGIVGLEYSFNKFLAGRNGQALFQKISGGSWKPVYDGTEVKAKNGLDIVTTINVDLQEVSESALLKALIANEADYGCVVVMEVSTGEIKAISNLSKNKKGEYWENYNYAVGSQGSREPGSTFKLASMIALFENAKISLYDSVDTGAGSYQFYDQTMKDHKPGGYGMLSVKEVFEYSSNIGTAKLITEVFKENPQEYIDELIKMGLTKPLGFQLVGEGIPYIKSPKDSTWSGVSLPWMSHGYELKMTPLHTLTLYNAVANGGKMIQPIIVKEIKKADRTIVRFESKVINKKICSDATLAKVHGMLLGVVEKGTAKNISNAYYTIAGKTGTAKNVVNGKYTNNYYTSFVGYFPANNPKYSCIVVIDNPKKYRIYGSDVAAPVFREITDKIYALDMELNESFQGQEMLTGIFPVIRAGKRDELSKICNELGVSNLTNTEAAWVKTKIDNNSVLWNKLNTDGNVVPDVRGMTLRDAIFLLENKQLKVIFIGNGRVTEQSILPGVRINDGYEIKLKLAQA